MKNTCIILLFFLSYLTTFSQYKEGTLFLKNDTEITGLIKLGYGNKIKYKKNKDSKKEIYTSKKVEKLVFINKTEYVYKLEEGSYLLLKKEISGNLELYSKENAAVKTGAFSYFSGGTYIQYYLRKKDNNFIERLPITRRRKIILIIFSDIGSDCTAFLEKIKDKKTAKKNFNFSYFKMIEFYNQNCSTK